MSDVLAPERPVAEALPILRERGQREARQAAAHRAIQPQQAAPG